MAPYRFFDHASTTPICERALQAWVETERAFYGNSTSTHEVGRSAAQALEGARSSIAAVAQVTPKQVVFTSSGTEADNLAIQGVAFAEKCRHASQPDTLFKNQIFVGAAEHAAIHAAADALQPFGFEVIEIPLRADGQLNDTWLFERVSDRTLLVSCMLVHNVVGTWFDLSFCATLKKRYPEILIHSDCVQAFCKVPLPGSDSGIDLLSISAHKVHGPKGVGALIALDPAAFKSGRIRCVTAGGGQENGFRSGTCAPSLAQSFSEAIHWTQSQQPQFSKKCESLRGILREELRLLIREGLLVWIEAERRISHLICLGSPSIPSKWLATQLDKHGFAVSSGSACSSKKSLSDPMVMALTMDSTLADSIVRVSFGHETDETAVRALGAAMRDALAEGQKLLNS